MSYDYITKLSKVNSVRVQFKVILRNIPTLIDAEALKRAVKPWEEYMTTINKNSDFFIIQQQLKNDNNLTYPTIIPWGHNIVEMTAQQRWNLFVRLTGRTK